MKTNPEDRFGVPEEAFISAIKSHGRSPALRSGVYVPTRGEVATLPLEDLDMYLNQWMWESPTELIPSREQIAQVKAILEYRNVEESFSQLIEDCREYIEDN